MTVRESIDKFIAFFRQQRLAIGQIEALPIYRKILYLVQIDALSRAAFPDEKGHKDRVLKFLNEHSNWSIGDRVSAIHLQDSLRKKGELSGPLFDLVNDRVQAFNRGGGTILNSLQAVDQWLSTLVMPPPGWAGAG